MRLSLITQDFPPDVGGIETYSYELSRRLSKWCRFFTVYAPGQGKSEGVDEELPFKIRRIGHRNTMLGMNLVPRLPYESYRDRIDASLHAQWQSVLPSLLSRKLGGCPSHIFGSAHARELLFNPFKDTPFEKGFRFCRHYILQQVDHWFPVSHYTRRLLLRQGVPENRTTVIPNGTNPRRFYPFNARDLRKKLGIEDRKVVLTITRLVKRKGIDDVVKAIDNVREQVPDIAYLIVGKGPERERLEKLVEDRKMESCVQFIGEVAHHELPRYYNACDLFVMPSKTVEPDVEGFGIVFLEANACGKPVIGTRSGGIPSAIEDEITGLLVEEGNLPELADAIGKLLDNTEWANKLGRQGRHRVERELNWDAISEKLYHAILDKIEETSPLT